MTSDIMAGTRRYTIKPHLPIWAHEGNTKISERTNLFMDQRCDKCAFVKTVRWKDKKGKINETVHTVKWIDREFTIGEIDAELKAEWEEIHPGPEFDRIKRRCFFTGTRLQAKYGYEADQHTMYLHNKHVCFDEYVIEGVRYRIAAAYCNEDSETLYINRQDKWNMEV